MSPTTAWPWKSMMVFLHLENMYVFLRKHYSELRRRLLKLFMIGLMMKEKPKMENAWEIIISEVFWNPNGISSYDKSWDELFCKLEKEEKAAKQKGRRSEKKNAGITKDA